MFSSTFLLINAIKYISNEEYINAYKFNGEEFKAYYGWIVDALYDLYYIYYRYCTYYMITGNIFI